MKIVGEKTETSLNIRVDSVADFLKYFWLSLIFLFGVTIALINPTSMKLWCHRVQTEIVCEVTTWNMLNLHSDKTDIKLQGVRYQDGRKSGPWVVLETSSGDIYSPDGIESLYRDLRQVQDFLQDKRQSVLYLDMTQHWFANVVRGMLLLLYLSITYQLLRFPIIVRWLFILDVEQVSADRSRSSGTLSKTVRSILGKKHTKSILHDVISIENKIVRVRKVARSKSYWIILRLRSGEKLSVCPSGLSEVECQKISRAIADILNIEPPAIPQY